MIVSDGSITTQQKRYIKNLCYMHFEEISINIIAFFMMKSKNFEGKTAEKQESPKEYQVFKTLISIGDSYFKI